MLVAFPQSLQENAELNTHVESRRTPLRHTRTRVRFGCAPLLQSPGAREPPHVAIANEVSTQRLRVAQELQHCVHETRVAEIHESRRARQLHPQAVRSN